MKTKCSFILKTSLALVLALMMAVGSVATVVAGVVQPMIIEAQNADAAKSVTDAAIEPAPGDDAPAPSADKADIPARDKDTDLAAAGANVNISSIGAEKKENYNFSGHTINLFIKSNSGTVNGSTGDKYIGLTQLSGGEWYQAQSIYMETNTTGSGKWNYYFKVEPYGSNWGDWLSFSHDSTGATFSPAVNNSYDLSWDWYKDGNNDTLALPVSSSGYLRMDFDTKGNDNGHGWIRWTANSVAALSGGSINAGTSNVYVGGTTSLSTTNPSGGSGDYTKGDYSVTRVSGDSSATATVSGNTFTAPNSVSSDTVFRVSRTITDNKCPNLTITLTRDITVKPNPTATISETGGTATTRSAVPTVNTSTSPGGSSTLTAAVGTTVYVHTHQNAGYKATVSVSGVTVTKDSSNLFHFTMPASSPSVSVSYSALATNLSITAHSNDSSLGTVTVNKASADEEETVTVTLTIVGTNAVLDNQSFRITKISDDSTVTATYVSGTTSPLVYSFVMPDGNVDVYAEFEEHLDDADFWYDAYQRKGKDSDADRGALVESEPFDLQFTESAYNGNLFAYVEVTREDADPCVYSASQTWAGRQPFVIRTGTNPAKATPSSGNRFYFKIPNWSDFSNTPTLKFYTGNTVIKSANCNHFKDDGSYKVWYYDVPAGADGVQVFGSNNASTVKVTGSLFNGGGIQWSTAYGSNISVTSYSSGQGNQYTPSAVVSGDGAYWDYATSKTADVDGINYAYIGDVTDGYSNKALEGGYNGKVGSGSTPMLKSEILNQPYYVIILYPGYDYGDIYETGTSVSSADHYRVYVSDKLPGTPDLTVNYYAKDGVVRMWNKSTGVFGTTTVTASDYVTAGTRKNFNQDTNCSSGSGAYNGWQKDETWLEGTCTKGQNITVTTTLDASVKDKYYIKGFSFNGVTPQIFEWRSDGIYTCTYSIPENLQGKKLEITPIYFLKDDSNCINFYIDGYNDTVKTAWGNELYVYPFYQYYKNGVSGTVTDLAGQAENYRAYPGQPVINYGGRRYMQIPLTDDGTAGGYRIKGVTINNGYWDQVHGDTKGTGDGHDNLDTMGADFVNVHRQTYDYDDFYKIYNEYGKGASKTLNNIYFTFKYRADGEQHRGTYADNKDTKTDQNSDNAVALTSANASTHTWELLKNNFNKPVDLFGNELTDAALTTYDGSEMYVISEGYEANNAGKFATEWAIYKKSGSTYTKVTETGGKTSIVPSVLVISEASRINATQYPALDGDLATTDYKGIYEALEDYTGVPVMICYEKELHGGSKSGGYDPAYRSDGRWTFTKTTDYVKANVKIEYINEKNGVTEYTEDPFTTNSNVGSITGAKAYFTYNAAESGYGAQYEGATSLSGLHIQDNKYFNFAAETAGSYEFMGWYSVDTNGDYHAVNNDDIKKVTGHSAMSSDSTFVARFKYVSNGSLSISHSLVAGDTGLGTTYLGVYVNGVQIADEATNTNSVRLDKTYIGSNKTSNTITIKLRTVPIGDTTFTGFTAKKVDPNEVATSITSGATYFDGTTTTTSGVTTREINFTVGDLYVSAVQQYLALNYYSDLTPATNNYLITYNFKDRSGADKTYSVKGTFTPGEMKSYFDGTGTSKTMKADATQFFTDHAPHESNFMKSLTWDLASTASIVSPTWTGSAGNYTFTASVNSTQNERDTITGVFDVPYEVQSLDAPKDFTPKATDGTIAMLDDDAHVTFEVSTTYGKWFENIPEGGSYSDNDRSSQLITAARTIYDADSEATMYFSYWQISSLTKYGTAGKDIARAYHPRFNYVGYENYYIKAIYTNDPEKAYDKLVDSEDEIKTSISFIEDSRNQWNDKNKGASDSEVDARDIIYNDFALSFHYGDKLLTDCVGSEYGDIRLGMVIQKLDEVDKNSGTHIGTLDSYEAKYQSSVQGTHDKLVTALASEKNGASAWGNGAWANIKYDPSDATKKYASYNHVIAANNESIALGTSTFNTELIDNKNRTEYYFSLDNSQGQTANLTAKNTYTNKEYVYRAFSYIMVKENGAWTVRVSDKPAYFCMYDRATMTK